MGDPSATSQPIQGEMVLYQCANPRYYCQPAISSLCFLPGSLFFAGAREKFGNRPLMAVIWLLPYRHLLRLFAAVSQYSEKETFHMTMLTIRLFDIASDAVHKVSAQVPVGAIIEQRNLLTDPPTSTSTAGKAGVTFRVPDANAPLETRNFIFVNDGHEVGNADENHLIGSYFPELWVEHARHLFEVLTPANS